MKMKYWAVALCVLVLGLILVSSCTCGTASTATSTATTTATQTATGTATQTATSTATATQTATATATATQTQTATSTPTGNNLSGILGLGANITSVRYDMTITTVAGTISSTIWEKNQNFREEMTVEGMTTIIIFDMDAGIMYNYLPDQGMATAMAIDQSLIPEGAAENPNDILDFNPENLGTETIDGKSCTVIQWTIDDGTFKEWIWTETGFPLKMETTTPAGTTTIEFTNIDFSDIDDSMFRLPEGVIVTTIG